MLLIAHIGAKDSIPALKETGIASNILTVVVIVFIASQVSRYESEHIPREVIPTVLIQTLHHSEDDPAVIAGVVHSVCQ